MRILLPIFIVVAVFVLVSGKAGVQPFLVTGDLTPQDFGKHGAVPDRDIHLSFVRYTKDAVKLLAKTPEKDLIEFSCGESFLRTDQGAYVFETREANEFTSGRIKNEELIDFLRDKERTFPRGKKFLIGRVCTLRDKTILLFYSIGSYDVKTVYILTPKGAIAYSQDNASYLEIFPKNLLSKRLFEIGESKNHLRCGEVFQLTKRELFILCESAEDYSTNYSLVKLNLNSGKTDVLKKCINKHKDRLETLCN